MTEAEFHVERGRIRAAEELRATDPVGADLLLGCEIAERADVGRVRVSAAGWIDPVTRRAVKRPGRRSALRVSLELPVEWVLGRDEVEISEGLIRWAKDPARLATS